MSKEWGKKSMERLFFFTWYLFPTVQYKPFEYKPCTFNAYTMKLQVLSAFTTQKVIMKIWGALGILSSSWKAPTANPCHAEEVSFKSLPLASPAGPAPVDITGPYLLGFASVSPFHPRLSQ